MSTHSHVCAHVHMHCTHMAMVGQYTVPRLVDTNNYKVDSSVHMHCTHMAMCSMSLAHSRTPSLISDTFLKWCPSYRHRSPLKTEKFTSSHELFGKKKYSKSKGASHFTKECECSKQKYDIIFFENPPGPPKH